MYPLANSGLLNLSFSQASLQDFVDCRRRFQLRHILRLAWPAIESEPVLENERLMQQGSQYHRLVQQYLIGIDPDRLSAMIHEPALNHWWDQFIRTIESGNLSHLTDPAYRRYPEVSLSAPLGGARLYAKCDLVIVGQDNRVVIYDWKTSRKRPERAWLAGRLQTRVYPYLLARAGAHLNRNQPFTAQDIELVYWFVDFPDQPEVFKYHLGLYQEDELFLRGLVEEISGLQETEFPQTNQVERCRFCVYRSYCDRGVTAGTVDELDDAMDVRAPGDITFDFDQIGEIAS
jgi:hypothetical protein